MVGICVLSVVLVSLYTGISASCGLTLVARENPRATQIMLERMEAVRLHTWDQLRYSNMIPATSTTSYYPLFSAGESTGITYRVKLTVTTSNLKPSATYSNRMRAITVTVFWTNYYGAKAQTNVLVGSHTMTTYSARDGIENYGHCSGLTGESAAAAGPGSQGANRSRSRCG